MAIAYALFAIFLLALELILGVAFVGWYGDNMVVEREKQPGPYWFTVVLHAVIGLGPPALVFFAR